MRPSSGIKRSATLRPELGAPGEPTLAGSDDGRALHVERTVRLELNYNNVIQILDLTSGAD